MRQLLYVGLHNGQLYQSSGGTLWTFPEYEARQTRTFALRFLNLVNGSLVEEELHVRSLRASIGWINNPPESGQFQIKIGTDPQSADNTTTDIDWVESGQHLLEAKLNALAGKPAAFRVLKIKGGWLIGLVTGAQITLEVVGNRLNPLSIANIEGTQISGAWWYELKITQAPLASTSTHAIQLPAAPWIETIVDGYTDPSGTYFVNEVQRFHLPPDFRSLFYFRRNGERTELLSATDNVTRYKEVLDALLARESATVATRLPDDYMVDIEFQGDLKGTDVDLLEIVIPEASTPPGDLEFSLDLGKWAMQAALRETDPLEDVPCEVIAEVVPNAEDIEDLDVPSKPLILFNVPLTLKSPLHTPALAVVENIDWQRGPAPRKYTPSLPDQILTGQQQGYPVVIGDGVLTEFTIDHNLDAEIAWIVIRENILDGRMLRTEEYTVHVNTSNSLTITFDDPPALNSLYAFIVAIGPASVFQAHNHTIGQIVGLQDILDEYGAAIADLQAVIPTIKGITTNDTVGMELEIPSTKEVLFYTGVTSPFTDKGALDTAVLPSVKPAMLPAVHAAVVSDVTDVPEDPATNAGVVFRNDSDEDILVAPGFRIRGDAVKPGEYFACDGRTFFKVARDGATNSYYPTAFERLLFTVPVNDSMLGIGQRLDVRFALKLQSCLADCPMQWVLELGLGVATSEDEPDPVGLNLEDITWNATPILRMPLKVLAQSWVHPFGVAIARNSGGLTLDRMSYGKWIADNAKAPASANFILRGRLTEADTVNSAPNARGWISYQILPPPTGSGEQTDTAITAKIIS